MLRKCESDIPGRIRPPRVRTSLGNAQHGELHGLLMTDWLLFRASLL
jgi:hypothetical protein